jgi:hypothetical protein
MRNKADDDSTVTIDGRTGKPDPTPKHLKLKTMEDVRLEMSRVYRDARQGRIDSQEGSRLIYMLGQLGKMITEAQPAPKNEVRVYESEYLAKIQANFLMRN